MRSKLLAVLAFALLPVSLAQSVAPNWIEEYLVVRAPQTKVVRHPVDRTRYYLCWQEGTNRFGMAFRRGSLEDKLKAMRPGASTSLATMVSASRATWTAADERICWGKTG